jgi:hypothetical protein
MEAKKEILTQFTDSKLEEEETKEEAQEEAQEESKKEPYDECAGSFPEGDYPKPPFLKEQAPDNILAGE